MTQAIKSQNQQSAEQNAILVAIFSFLLGILSCYIASVIGKRKNETLNNSINVAKYPSDDEMKMTLIIRTDLQMGKGKVCILGATYCRLLHNVHMQL